MHTHVHTYCICILPGTQFFPLYGAFSVVVIYFPNCNTTTNMLAFFDMVRNILIHYTDEYINISVI